MFRTTAPLCPKEPRCSGQHCRFARRSPDVPDNSATLPEGALMSGFNLFLDRDKIGYLSRYHLG